MRFKKNYEKFFNKEKVENIVEEEIKPKKVSKKKKDAKEVQIKIGDEL